ncbi:MAG: excisionase family DNA-binding protein [Phycisphaerales bacterium]|nr:excisionase family DNA-binding protein [Phycisphaerales bacterium]
MAKMFYTTEEAAQKLGVTTDALKQLVSENKLREFRDGARVMFKVDQVDRMAGDTGKAPSPGLSDSGIPLGPSASGSDVISLSDTGVPSTAKEDTVVTGQGVQVFGKGEVKPADAAAQTRIQSAIDDQLSLEGVGSGSGLLDLTRESDDTSLGAELLDEIYPGGEKKKGDSGVGSSSGIFEQSAEASGPSGLEHIAGAPVGAAVDYVEARDPYAGAFGGMALASALIMFLIGGIAAAVGMGYSPEWLEKIYQTGSGAFILGGALFVLALLFAGVGLFAGKASAR